MEKGRPGETGQAKCTALIRSCVLRCSVPLPFFSQSLHPGTRGSLTETSSALRGQNPETTALGPRLGRGVQQARTADGETEVHSRRSTARGEEGGASCPAGCAAPGPPPPAPSARAPRLVFAVATPSALRRVMVAALVAAWLLLAAAARAQREQDFYDFKAVNIRGKLVSLEKYRGSVSLVVNVASECGFTDQHYRALQQLQRDLGPHHFNVLAFPCNQFGQQEPDSNKEIESFARRTYSVSFPMFSKIAVTGTGAHPAFKYLTQTSGKEPTWNFWKYLVAPDGKVVGAWDPTVSVEEIRPQITALVRKLILKKREDL
uniref:Glutathione peroxidase n=1 Tax=Sus scrofa TaxID=9823 RepID=A0A8D2BP16_PIG